MQKALLHLHVLSQASVRRHQNVLAMQDLDQAEAKAAFVWILGHYGESIQARPPDVEARTCIRVVSVMS